MANADREREEPEYVGLSDAAEILGVSRQRIGQLYTAGRFPAMAFRVSSGPVWRRSDVTDFAASRRTVPGPAPSTSETEND